MQPGLFFQTVFVVETNQITVKPSFCCFFYLKLTLTSSLNESDVITPGVSNLNHLKDSISYKNVLRAAVLRRGPLMATYLVKYNYFSSFNMASLTTFLPKQPKKQFLIEIIKT